MLLLTNDDGFDADGIRALERAASRWRSSVITVAPLILQGDKFISHQGFKASFKTLTTKFFLKGGYG